MNPSYAGKRRMALLVALALPVVAVFSLEMSRGQFAPRQPVPQRPSIPRPPLPAAPRIPNKPLPNGVPQGFQGNNPNPNGIPQGVGGMGIKGPNQNGAPQGFGGVGNNNPNFNGVPQGVPANPFNRPAPNALQGQGFNPNPPFNNLNPNFTMRDNVWFCSGCNREVGRGPTKPNLARCPFCNIRFTNTPAGSFDGTVGAIIGVVVLVVFGVAGIVVRALRG